MIHRRSFLLVLAVLICGMQLLRAQDSLQIGLMKAIEQNDLKAIKQQFKLGADANESIVSSSPSYLFFLSRRLYLDGLKKGMKGDAVYVSPVHASANRANLKVLKLLKKHKANIEAGDSDGKTPLMYALRNPGGEEYALMLLKKGANYRAVDAGGNTAMHYAAYGGNMEGVKMVAGGGVNINVRNNDSITPFMAAAVFGSVALLEDMKLWEADINAKDDQGMGALHYAAAFGGHDKLDWLLKQNPALNGPASNGYTPLDIAKEAGNRDAIDFLKANGGRVGRYRHAELMQAIEQRKHQLISELLADGVNPNFKQAEWPLIAAVKNGDNVSASMLLNAGADVNALSQEGNTALQIALASGHPTTMAELLRAGGQANEGMIGEVMEKLAIAEMKGDWREVVQLLAKDPKQLNALGGTLQITPLQFACYLGEEKLAAALVEAGADIQALDNEGWTALHWAVIKRDLLRIHLDKYHIAQMLIEKGANVNQASTSPKLLPHTDAYLPKRIPAGANPYDLLAYALPKDADMAELLEASKPQTSLKASNYLENGIELAQMSAHQAALLEYNKALQLDPQMAEAYYRRALSKSMLSMYQEVERDLSAAVKLKPFYPEAFLARAKARIELDKYAAAEEDVNLALKQGHEKGECYYWRGKARLRLGRREDACQDFQNSNLAGYKDGAGALKLFCK